MVPRQGDRSNPRVSHVGFGVRMEDLAAARHLWEWNFGLEFEESITLDPGLKVPYAPGAGIELVITTDNRAPDFVAGPLARWGEGQFVTAFAVDSLTGAKAAVAIEPPSMLSCTGHPDWVDRYQRLDQAILPEVHGIRVALTEVKRRLSRRVDTPEQLN
jgi:hypothetical protein